MVKERSSTDNNSMQNADEVIKSPSHFLINKMYVTRPEGPEKENVITRLERGTPEATSSYRLLFPILSFPAAFFSTCDKPLGSRPPPRSAPSPKS